MAVGPRETFLGWQVHRAGRVTNYHRQMHGALFVIFATGGQYEIRFPTRLLRDGEAWPQAGSLRIAIARAERIADQRCAILEA